MSELLDRQSELPISLDEDERWLLVQRVAASRHLAKAPQLREILLYISRRLLAAHAVAIGEQEIGCTVLGRRLDFNPNEDNIVRVQIRHLRKKLEDYFSTEGLGESLIITIPKGGYLPHFEPRPESPPQPVDIATPTAPSPASPPKRSRRAIWLLALVTVAALAGLALWKQRHPSRPAPAAEETASREDPLWSKVFAPHRQTSVVVADTNLVMVQDILDTDIALRDYLLGGYPEKLIATVPNRELRAALRLISARQYTSLGDAIVASKFMELTRHFAAEATLRYARYVSVREFKNGNFVLIGSRRGIPWVQLFESQLNFSLEEDPLTRHYRLRNKSPLPGERTFYALPAPGSPNEETYADIALLPNLTGTGYVLMLSGIDMAATEAAGELVTSPGFGVTVAKLLNSAPGEPPAAFIEIVLEAKVTAGTSGGAKIVAYRRIEGPRPTP